MYSATLVAHSWIRWFALIAAVGTTLAALRRRDAAAERWGLFAMAALDVQMLLGLLLYFVVSPNMREILAHFSDAMKEPASRFWAVEHLSAMFAAVITAHVGRALARNAKTPDAKRSKLLVAFGLATVLMLAGMPWPGRPGGRPLFRI